MKTMDIIIGTHTWKKKGFRSQCRESALYPTVSVQEYRDNPDRERYEYRMLLYVRYDVNETCTDLLTKLLFGRVFFIDRLHLY